MRDLAEQFERLRAALFRAGSEPRGIFVVLAGLSLAIATALATIACYTMRPVILDDLVGKPASRVWVTRQDQSVVVVDGPQVFRGKLVGFVDGRYREMPPADWEGLVARRLARGKTLALIGAGAAGFTLAAVLLSGSGNDHDPCVGGPVDCSEIMPAVDR